MAPLKTPLTRAAALKTLELSEPPVCEKQKIERAHRALKRRYLPNEVTPPAAAPYFRRIEKAYSVLETSHVANTDTRKVRGDSSEPIDKRFTALAFFNSGFGSRTPSPTPSGTQDAESLHEDAAPADPDVEPINEAIEAVNDLVAPAFVNAPSQTFKLWLMKEIKYLAIGLAVSLFLNSTGIAVFGEQFIIADKIAAFILGMVLTVAGYVVGFSKGFLQMPESRALLKANSTMPTPRHKLVEAVRSDGCCVQFPVPSRDKEHSPIMTPSIRIALQTLNLTTPCTAKDIKLSYRLLILRYHPDKSRTTATTARFQAVQEAYETLEKAGYLNQQEVNAHDDEPASEEPDPPYRRKPPSAAPPREFKIFTPPTPRNNIWAKHQKAREDRLRAEKGPTRRARGRGGRRFSVFDKSSPLWKTRMRAYAAEEGKEPRKAAEAGDDQRRKADAQPATTASAAAAKRASNESKADKSDRKPHDPPAPTKAKTSPLGATNKHKVGRSRIRNCSRGRSFSLYACSTVFWLCLLPGCRMMFEGLWTGRWDIGLLGLLLCEGNDWLWWAMLRELKGSRVDDEA